MLLQIANTVLWLLVGLLAKQKTNSLCRKSRRHLSIKKKGRDLRDKYTVTNKEEEVNSVAPCVEVEKKV
jgi:hypothetical protein